jgi:hypothetical protein
MLAVAALPLPAQQLLAGAAQVVITPPQGMPMAGYYSPRSSTGVHDDLHANALVLRQGKVTVAIVSCDVIHMPAQIVAQARRLIRSQSGIAESHVMISATHAHTGPVIPGGSARLDFGGKDGEMTRAYAAVLPAKIADAVQQAAAALKPARIRSAAGSEPTLTFNRRFHMTDGTVGWNPGKLNPKIVAPAGPIDPEVGVVSIESPGGAPLSTLVNYALHLDTVGGLDISADYPFTLSKSVAASRPGLTIFTLGCAGNLNHIDVKSSRPQKGHEEAARIGSTLGAEVIRTLGRLDAAGPRLTVASNTVQLRPASHDPSEIDWARKTSATFGLPKPAPFLELVKAFRILDVEALAGKPLDAEVQVIGLNQDTALVALPGEIFTELGLAIKKDSPFKHTFVVELANGSLGYVPDRKAFGEGNYEAVSARCEPGSGEKLVEAALALLNQIKRN